MKEKRELEAGHGLELWLSQAKKGIDWAQVTTEEEMSALIDRLDNNLRGPVANLQYLPYLFADDIDTLKSDDNLREKYLTVAEHLLNTYEEFENKSYKELLEFTDDNVIGTDQEKASLFEEVWRRKKRKEVVSRMLPREKEIWTLINNQFSDADLRRELLDVTSGIPTGWRFDIGTEHPFELVIPAGAITGISAPTGHGKTRMAENIICAVLEQWEKAGEKDKRVLYIHYEESDIDVIQHLANIHLNTDINKEDVPYVYPNGYSGYNNLDKIRNHIISFGGYSYNHPFNDLDRALDWVFAARESGRLDLAADIDSIEWIRAAVERGKDIGDLALVVIDNVQRIKSEGLQPGTDKKTLMEFVCDDLNNIARDSMLPIVVTSQLNRQCNSALDLSLNKNSDATNLEQTFNTNLLFWNSTFDPLTPPNFGKDKTAAKLMAAGYDFEGTPGKLVCKLGKNRGGQANVWSILDFDGNTGRISQPKPMTEDERLRFVYREIL